MLTSETDNMLLLYTICVISLNTPASSRETDSILCTVDDQTKMKEAFINCTSSYKEEYNLALGEEDVDEEEVTCWLMENIVGTCGDLWRKCHTEEEVRRMKDMQVESLLYKNRGASIDIEICPTSKEFR